jgi:DNA-binding PadR family transcriptional regulator
MRRGDIRPVLLTSLLEGPAHGYEIIRRLEQRSGGVWRPSAGSVYPTLQMLEEEGLLSSETNAGKRVYELTDSGRVAAEQAAAHGPQSPWERGGPPESTGPRELRLAAEQLQLAARQVVLAGDAAQVDQAVAILKEARQRLYQLLAER